MTLIDLVRTSHAKFHQSQTVGSGVAIVSSHKPLPLPHNSSSVHCSKTTARAVLRFTDYLRLPLASSGFTGCPLPVQYSVCLLSRVRYAITELPGCLELHVQTALSLSTAAVLFKTSDSPFLS